MKETIKSVKVSDLYPFPDNPFKVVDNEELQAITESIKAYGVILL